MIDREKFGQCTHLKHNEQGFFDVLLKKSLFASARKTFSIVAG